jgi:hypothetical protein
MIQDLIAWCTRHPIIGSLVPLPVEMPWQWRSDAKDSGSHYHMLNPRVIGHMNSLHAWLMHRSELHGDQG